MLHSCFGREYTSAFFVALMKGSTVETTLAQPAGTGRDHNGHSGQVPLSRIEYLLIAAFWTLVALIALANELLDPGRQRLQPAFAAAPATLAFIHSFVWAALTPLVFRLSSYIDFERSNRFGRLALVVAVGIVIAILVSTMHAYLRFRVFYVPRLQFSIGPLETIRHLFFLKDLIVYMALIAAGFGREYYLRYQERQRDAVLLQAHAAQLKTQLADARLSALRTQLNPHFLFNTLNAISALVERDPAGVRRMITRLSELLRHSLEGHEENEIPLRAELAFLTRYIEIMQIRFQGRLEVTTRIDPQALDALVPNLILQPLVENAIVHGVNKVSGIARIEIAASRDGERILLRVRDNGPGLVADAASVTERVGLRNTRARLAEMYDDEQKLTLYPADGAGLVAEISLPYHTGADLRAAGMMVES